MTNRMAGLRTRFRAARDGSVAIIFALVLTIALLTAGMAIDYGEMYRVRSQLQQIADAAALAATSRARTDIISSGLGIGVAYGIAKKAETTADNFFSAQIKEAGLTANKSSSVKISQRTVTATVSFTSTYKPSLLSMFGFTSIDLAGTSKAESDPVPYMEVTLMIDTSGSMALGADADDQQLLKDQLGCAFACHDGSPVGSYADAYAYALAQGIKLRYQAINEGILNLIDEFDTLDPYRVSIKAGVWSFETSEKLLQAQTTDRSKLRSNLPSAPATSGETQGATHFNEAIQHVMQTIGKGGDGSVPGHPIKLLIIATDGAQDPGRFWTSQTAYRAEVDAFDMSFCDELKNDGVKVGILHTPYLPMTYDWGYNITLGMPSQRGGPATRADDIPIGFKECAGSLYVEADDSSKIVAGFVEILKNVSVPRLTQ